MADDRQDNDVAQDSRIEGGSQQRGGRGGSSANRPRSVYAVLAVGVLALLSLLLIIYFSSDRNLPEQPICTTVSLDTAREAVLEGRIRRITMAYDDTAAPPASNNWGPVLARLDYTDGQCANMPQGIVNQDDIYLLLGAITVFNDITETTQVEINYDRQTSLDARLFATPAPEPTATAEPTPTPESTPEDDVDAPPIIGPVSRPSASPAATPVATPDEAI